ncbi:MAG: MBOAT family protein [Lachnospiraceae bacterium]|nr:MBOAT family protein [Lachnospiraceae bacterium]
MLFSTAAFAVFMAVVFIVYWCMPHKYRWVIILFANAWFYISYDIKYLAVILVTMIASYICAIMIENKNGGSGKKIIMVTGVLVTLSLLLVFKYLNFALYTVAKVFNALSIPMQETTLKLIMPVGISFYTFMTVGYIVDVYKGRIPAERHFGKYAIFVSFFPNISSGPIERAGHFIPQIDKKKIFDYDEVTYGARLLLLGMVKKIVIADMMAKYVDEIFNKVPEHYGICFAWATLLYTFQIYCDFSGYSDMAVGVAKMLGFELVNNFKQPYFASSIKEFWGRWHISLSSWFRDYVYIPLGGNRCSRLRRDMNLLITFLCSGLWHGASWTFVLWGGIHGICQIAENRIKEAAGLTKEKEAKLGKPVKFMLTLISFCIVSYAWMFFRANSISEALYIVRSMFSDISIKGAMMQMTMSSKSVIKTTVAIVLLIIFDLFNEKKDMLREINKIPSVFRFVIYVVTAIIVIALKVNNNYAQEFIYFKF